MVCKSWKELAKHELATSNAVYNQPSLKKDDPAAALALLESVSATSSSSFGLSSEHLIFSAASST